MCRERLVVIFDNWDYDVDCEGFEKVRSAVEDGDFETVAKYFKIENAGDIRIQTAVERWENIDD